MWFRNLQIFRLAADWAYSADQLAERLTKGAFQSCGATDRAARGWLPPRGDEHEMVLTAGPQQLVALGVEQKLLPSAVVKQYAAARQQKVEEAQGFKLGRKQARDLRDEVELELLPRAFVKRSLLYAWIDPVNRWLLIDTTSPARADEFIEHLKATLGELPLSLLKTAQAPGTAMTDWLAAGDAPAGFSIDRDCELRAVVEERPAVRYVRHPLDGDEVKAHIGSGKIATRLALTWNNRVSFVLTEQMHVKRLAFLDVIKENAEKEAENAADLFAAEFALMAGELALLLADLTAALGGEAE